MNDIITTKSIGKGIAETDSIVLEEKPLSRLIFKPLIHNQGIRGFLIRQKRSNKIEEWKDEQAIKLKELADGFEGVKFEIPTEGVLKFYIGIRKIASVLKEKGIEYGENNYSVVDSNALVITDQNVVKAIKKIISLKKGEDFWKELVKDDFDLAKTLVDGTLLLEKKRVIDDLKSRLGSGSYHETAGDDSWQNWIKDNNWILGVSYSKPIEKAKINLDGIMPDYLFPTIDGFIDILEIKLPTDDVIKEDLSHKGAWRWTSEANKAIGQVVNYLAEIERLRLENERKINNSIKNIADKVLCLKPRAFILIGNSESWSTPKIEALRNLNYHIHNIDYL